MNLLIHLCVGIGISMAAPLNEPVLIIDPTPPPGYVPGPGVGPGNIPDGLGKDLRPRDDPRLMIDPTPPADYQPGYGLQKDVPRELIPIVDPARPGQYPLPNEPGVMIDPTPPPGYVPTVSDMRTDPTINPKEHLIMIDPPHFDEDDEGEPYDPEFFSLNSGFADLDRE